MAGDVMSRGGKMIKKHTNEGSRTQTWRFDGGVVGWWAVAVL